MKLDVLVQTYLANITYWLKVYMRTMFWLS